MNILTDEELREIGFGSQSIRFARAIESAVLSKLAEQAGEPVAWARYPRFTGRLQTAEVVFKDPQSSSWEKLYTEAHLIAAQQRTAEACAKVCENLPHKFRTEFSKVSSECAAAIRNNWREYL